MTMELSIAQLKMLIIGTEVLSNFKSSTPDRSNDPWPISDSQSYPIRNMALCCNLLTSMPTVGKLYLRNREPKT